MQRRQEGDVVLVYFDDKPGVFGRIEAIESDVKPGWYQLTLLLLTLPTQVVTWILRDVYIDGDPFTMGGRPMRIEAVKRSSVPRDPEESEGVRTSGKARDTRKIIPFKKPEGG
jgi:hypothetical protein